MLLSLILELDPSWEMSRRPGALRALTYALFALADPALATELHDGGGERPFTVAALPGRDPLRVRVTALDERAGRALAMAAGAAVGRAQVALRRSVVRVSGCLRDAPPLAEATDYAALAALPFAPKVALRFVAPAAFSQGGDRHLPLPVPDLLLRGWARRWNLWAPRDMLWDDETVSALAGRVAVARARIETQTVDLDPGKLVGFTGTVTLEALRLPAWTDRERGAFAALTAFSRFCGSGARTTQGLGLTLPDDGPGASARHEL